MIKAIPHIILIILLNARADTVTAQDISLSGQLIGWTAMNPTENLRIQGGARYIPEIRFSLPLGILSLEGEGSLNLWGSTEFTRTGTNESEFHFDSRLDPYRVWVKLSGHQFELRAGLQKINFGPARMLRPLMWFDKIDPRDPLQLTDGVYGLLGRYYFLNNVNIWLWGLYGNDQRKGLEQFPTKEKGFEYGGRIQVPVVIGETAISYHHREADPDAVLPDSLHTGKVLPESRLALDTKVDLLVGLWLEGSWSRYAGEVLPLDHTTMLNTGMDYTFNIGNGLNIMGEGFILMAGDKPFSSEQTMTLAGTTISYPLNIIHNLSAIAFWDITNKNLYRFINWSATYDRWTFYTMAFWNPKTYQLYNFQQEASLFSGAGFQVMAVFNH